MCVFVLREEKSFLIKEILYLNSLLIEGSWNFRFQIPLLILWAAEKKKGGRNVCDGELHQVRSLDGVIEILWRTNETLLLASQGPPVGR